MSLLDPLMILTSTTNLRWLDVTQFGAIGDGITDDTAAVQAALNASQAACIPVYMPPTTAGYLIGGAINMPAGTTLLGAFFGFRKGLVQANLSPRGTTLLIPATNTGVVFTLNATCTVQGFEIFHKDQATSGTPTIYGYVFFAGLAASSCTIRDICLINAYNGISMQAQGGRIANVQGWCLYNAIYLGRCADCVWVDSCNFNPNSWAPGAGLVTWYLANAHPYVIDGAEAFGVTNCFSWGGVTGVWFVDWDADGFIGTGGSWVGGGFDQCGVGILVTSGVGMTGVKFFGIDVVPVGGGGAAIKCEDNLTSPIQSARPRIFVHGMSMHNGLTYARGIWMVSTSHANVYWDGGFAIDYTNEIVLNQSANCTVHMDHVEGNSALTRVTNTGGGVVSDTNTIAYTLP